MILTTHILLFLLVHFINQTQSLDVQQLLIFYFEFRDFFFEFGFFFVQSGQDVGADVPLAV